jgi:hypothetical protein
MAENIRRNTDFEDVVVSFLTENNFQMNMILNAPDEICQISNFTDNQSIYTNEPPTRFYCLPSELDSLKQKAIEQATQLIEKQFQETKVIRPNEIFSLSL